ncbi:hypothetical protein L9F63_009590, partial [Diploptera punctata]
YHSFCKTIFYGYVDYVFFFIIFFVHGYLYVSSFHLKMAKNILSIHNLVEVLYSTECLEIRKQHHKKLICLKICFCYIFDNFFTFIPD